MLRPVMEQQPGPLVQGMKTIRRSGAVGPIAALALGFVASASFTFAAVAFAGAAFGIGGLPAGARLVAAAFLAAGMLAVDVASLRSGAFCKLTLRRQTPKALEEKYGPRLGPMMWGIDTGMAVTTIRVSAITWVALGLVLLQLAPWWLGLAYGVGFCLPLAAFTLLPPWRPDDKFGEPMWVQHLLSRWRPAIQASCILGLIALGGATGLSAVGG